MAIITGNTILASDVVNNIIYSGVDSSGSDAYAISPTPALISYVTGQTFVFKAGTNNTGPSSLNVSGLGAKTIKKNFNVDTETGDIVANEFITLIFDGTNMQMVSTARGLFNNGIASLSTGSQTIAHGLGRIPRKIRLTTENNISGATFTVETSIGAYDGTHNSNVFTSVTQNNNGTVSLSNSSSTSYGIKASGNTGIITFDSTNITITWTGSNGVSGNILWEAEA